MKARIFLGGVGVLALIGVAASGRLGVASLDVKPNSAFADAPKPNADISNDPKVRELTRQIKASPRSLKLRRQLADRYVELGQSRQAADAYAREAALHRRGPRPNLGQSIISQQKTSRYSTDVRLFQDRPATAPELARLNTRARLEPAVVCYIGAFIEGNLSRRKLANPPLSARISWHNQAHARDVFHVFGLSVLHEWHEKTGTEIPDALASAV